MNVMIIGAGGIGSYFVNHISRLLELKQINDVITCYDDDIVEKKNMLYQNFDTGDIDSLKVDALSYRYPNIQFKNQRLNIELLQKLKNDFIIICADNNQIRREVFETGIPFLDSRANGKTVGIFSSRTENYLSTMDTSTKSSSCQNPFQIEKKEIEYGNVVVAAMLAQSFLSYRRNNRLPDQIIFNF